MEAVSWVILVCLIEADEIRIPLLYSTRVHYTHIHDIFYIQNTTGTTNGISENSGEGRVLVLV